MKKLNVALFAIGILIFTSCGEKKKEADTDVEAKVEVRNTGDLKMAFYHQDSVAKYFDYFRIEDSLIQKKQMAFQKELEGKQKALQDYIATQEKRRQSGLLSENEVMQVQQNIQNQEMQIYEFQQSRGQKLEEEALKKMEVISTKVKKFSEDFCLENKLDILFVYADGTQIKYITPSMDVTKEFTNYLNKRQSEIEKDIKGEK